MKDTLGYLVIAIMAFALGAIVMTAFGDAAFARSIGARVMALEAVAHKDAPLDNCRTPIIQRWEKDGVAGIPTVTTTTLDALIGEAVGGPRDDIAELRMRVERAAHEKRDLQKTLHEWCDGEPYGSF